MPRHLFDIDEMILARTEFIREARDLPQGAERNQKRQIAISLKRLIQTQIVARDSEANVRGRARPRFKQTAPLDQRMAEQAELLRKKSEVTPPGAERDKLLRQTRQLDRPHICPIGWRHRD